MRVAEELPPISIGVSWVFTDGSLQSLGQGRPDEGNKIIGACLQRHTVRGTYRLPASG